jgi:hypothetical protein
MISDLSHVVNEMFGLPGRYATWQYVIDVSGKSIGCPESSPKTSETNCHSGPCNIPEKQRSQQIIYLFSLRSASFALGGYTLVGFKVLRAVLMKIQF